MTETQATDRVNCRACGRRVSYFALTDLCDLHGDMLSPEVRDALLHGGSDPDQVTDPRQARSFREYLLDVGDEMGL